MIKTMIKTAREMLGALKRAAFTGVILYEGPSAIDGAPIVVIACRIVTKSRNEKTGAMVQTFIIRSDMHPAEAIKTGADRSICGDCVHRPANKNTCYVDLGKSVRSVFDAYKRGRYARPGVDYEAALIPDLFAGLMVRLGSYGDPAAAPFQVWRAATLKAAGINGYSHQWRNPAFQAFRLVCMASVESFREMQEAQAMGWRTFRVRHFTQAPVARAEINCPASAEAGRKTACADCRACGGLEAKARASVSIVAHGPRRARFKIAA